MIKQFDPKPMAQITKESMQEQRAAEAWFHTQTFIPNVLIANELFWVISKGLYDIDYIAWVYVEPKKHQEKLRGFKKKRDLFLKPLKGEFLVCSLSNSMFFCNEHVISSNIHITVYNSILRNDNICLIDKLCLSSNLVISLVLS